MSKGISSIFERHPKTIFFLSLSFFLIAVGFVTYDTVYLKAKIALAGSYNAFLSHMWPIGLPNRTDQWENENSKALHALFTCMGENNCKENQTSIVMLASPHFGDSLNGHVSGENIWYVVYLLLHVPC